MSAGNTSGGTTTWTAYLNMKSTKLGVLTALKGEAYDEKLATQCSHPYEHGRQFIMELRGANKLDDLLASGYPVKDIRNATLRPLLPSVPELIKLVETTHATRKAANVERLRRQARAQKAAAEAKRNVKASAEKLALRLALMGKVS